MFVKKIRPPQLLAKDNQVNSLCPIALAFDIKDFAQTVAPFVS
jgi:hypothetical protein